MLHNNPLTSSGGIISPYRNGQTVTNNRLGLRVLPSEENGYQRPKENRDDFIERMRSNPNLWGGGKAGRNGNVSINQGHVSIYHADGHLSRTFYFNSRRKKKDVISTALRQIKHLRCCYIEIKYK